MPAPVVVVLLDEEFSHVAAEGLRKMGYETICLFDLMVALDALEKASRIELLVTGLDFGPRRPNGIALARMARLKRPGIKVLFIGPGNLAHHANELGEFLALPVTAEEIIEQATLLLPL